MRNVVKRNDSGVWKSQFIQIECVAEWSLISVAIDKAIQSEKEFLAEYESYFLDEEMFDESFLKTQASVKERIAEYEHVAHVLSRSSEVSV